MDFGCVEICEGFTRISSVLFAILWTYMEVRQFWDASMENNFEEQLDLIN